VEVYNKIVRDEFLAGEDISMSQIAWSVISFIRLKMHTVIVNQYRNLRLQLW